MSGRGQGKAASPAPSGHGRGGQGRGGQGRGDQGRGGQGRGGQGRGGQGRGGQGQGSGRGSSNKDIPELKKNLLHTIKNAETLLKELDLKKGSQPKQPGRHNQDTRGSKSLLNLNSGSNDKNSRGGASFRSRGHPRGRGGGGRGGMNTSGPSDRGVHFGYGQSMPPPLMGFVPPLIQGGPPLYRGPGVNTFPSGSHFNAGSHFNTKYIPSAPPVHSAGSIPPQEHHPHKMTPPQNNPYGMPPPPTYEESIEDLHPLDQPKKSYNETSKKPPRNESSQQKLTADALVKTLSKFTGQFENAETISRQLVSDPNSVVCFAKSRKDLFAVMGEGKDAMIEFVPKVSLCSDYYSEISCNSRDACENLHICKTYVTNYCDAGASCQYGHRWDTNHNKKILSKFYLDIIDRNMLRQVVRKLYKESFKLDTCNFYNSDRGCRYNVCKRLHICKSYVLGSGKCSVKDCTLNHNIVDKQCIDILKASGVTVNESPRDILLHVMTGMGKQLEKESSKAIDTNKSNKKRIKDKASVVSNSSSEDSDTEESDDTEDENPQHKKKSDRNKNRQKKTKVKTCRSTDLKGDVVIPEICIFSIDGSCINEKRGCKYLHAKSLFHWQVEKSENWYNLRIFQSKKLETAYRDVSTSTVDVPALDQSKLEDFAKELLNILGTRSWKADFQTMIMKNNDQDLKIRRVSTQSSVIFNNPKATVFGWYFKDNKGKWIQYGQVDSVGNQHLICNISSEDIEKQYLCDPSSSMLVCNAEYKYKLDFSKMIQVNMQKDTEREIRRRPARLSYQSKSTTEEDPNSALPSHWNHMIVNQTHLLVSLEPESTEFLDVSSRLRLALPMAHITSIKRLQNPYLWRLLQYKKAHLSRRYDENQLNMQKLFHGVASEDIETICKENFDWRQVSNVPQDHGQGTYFSNSAAVGRKYSPVDDFGRITMFLAQVIIGLVVKGEAAMTRPPSNPATNALFDTTVDDVTAPTVFVKYDKEEYYPEYIIEFY